MLLFSSFSLPSAQTGVVPSSLCHTCTCVDNTQSKPKVKLVKDTILILKKGLQKKWKKKRGLLDYAFKNRGFSSISSKYNTHVIYL
jgi:hypothetical protein